MMTTPTTEEFIEARRFIVDEWIPALRSGNYNQGQGRLRYGEADDSKYCCLGVACDLVDPEGWSAFDKILTDWGWTHQQNSYSLTLARTTIIGRVLASLNVPYGSDSIMAVSAYLPYLNDSLKCSFDEIATCLEETVVPLIDKEIS